MTPRARCVVPFVTVLLVACGGRARPHAAVNQSSGSAMAGGGSATSASKPACTDVAGSWLLGQNDGGGGDLRIAQDGCDVAVSWTGSYSGTISGSSLTFSDGVDPSFACSAVISGDSLSGTCTGETADGSDYDCGFDAVFDGKGSAPTP
jgi:hypothetical protein